MEIGRGESRVYGGLSFRNRAGGETVVTALLVIALVVAISRWIVYRLSFMAVLLYYAECGQKMPDHNTIQKYQTKAALKLLGIKAD